MRNEKIITHIKNDVNPLNGKKLPEASETKHRAYVNEFKQRLGMGHSFESQVQYYLWKQYGLRIFKCGLEQKPEAAIEQLIKLNDPTSLEIRFDPDFICFVPGLPYSFYIECKSDLSMTNSGNFSFDLEAYNHLVRKAYEGIRILCVVPGTEPSHKFICDWIENLEKAVVKKVTDPEKLKNANGSGKSFVVISKVKMRPLDFLMSEIIEGLI